MFHSYVSLPEGKSIEIPRIFLEIHIQLQQLNPAASLRARSAQPGACPKCLLRLVGVHWRCYLAESARCNPLGVQLRLQMASKSMYPLVN
jgi:hypothetical protein